MVIKLICPRMSLRPVDSEYKRAMAPSMALITLAALTPKEHQVYIVDENVEDLDFDDQPDLVGLTVNIDTSYRAYEIAKVYKEKNIPVVMGGIHASANPDEALGYCDAVCIGEAEEIWKDILQDAEQGRLRKRYKHNQPTDLAKIPIPRWDLIKKNKYLYTNTVYTSRNCPFRCGFCYNSCDYTFPFRNRPIDKVIDEIKKLGTRHIMFIDDNFIGDPKWTKEFLLKIKPLRLKWNAAVSANIAEHLSLLDLMKETGCQSLFIGFETINRQSLQSVRKYQNEVANYENIIKEIHQRGIMINASLVFGFDHDYPNVFEDTLNWLVKNKIETMTAHILTPYPGTALFEEFKKQKRIFDFDWRHYNTSQVVFEPRHLSKEQLYEGYLWMYKEFYSLKNIIKRRPGKKDQVVAYLLFNFGYKKFGKLVSKLAKAGFMSRLGRLARRLAYNIE